MTTIINQRIKKDLDLTDHEAELLHMISFEYTEDEIQLESHWSATEMNAILQSLYKKTDTETYVGLVRVAFEFGILRLIQN